MWRQEGFRYHHAEPDYLMLVYWIPETAYTLPANATHRVVVGAIVMNDKREVSPLTLQVPTTCMDLLAFLRSFSA